MKKFSILLMLSLAVAATFTSCNKDDDDDAQPTLGFATISGKVKADLNLKNDTAGTIWEYPEGKTIYFVINTEDLVINSNGGNYADKVYTATVDAQGNYSVNIEANTKPVTVHTVYGDEFLYDQIQFDGTTKQKEYNLDDPGNIVVHKGQKIVQDLFYDFF